MSGLLVVLMVLGTGVAHHTDTFLRLTALRSDQGVWTARFGEYEISIELKHHLAPKQLDDYNDTWTVKVKHTPNHSILWNENDTLGDGSQDNEDEDSPILKKIEPLPRKPRKGKKRRQLSNKHSTTTTEKNDVTELVSSQKEASLSELAQGSTRINVVFDKEANDSTTEKGTNSEDDQWKNVAAIIYDGSPINSMMDNGTGEEDEKHDSYDDDSGILNEPYALPLQQTYDYDSTSTQSLRILNSSNKATTRVPKQVVEVDETMGSASDERNDESKEYTRPTIDENKEHTGPTTDDRKEYTGPTIDESKEYTGPTIDESKKYTGPIIDESKEYTGPTIDESKKYTGPTIDESKEHTGPTIDESKKHTGPTTDDRKEYTGPIIDESKEYTGPTIDESKEHTGPTIDDRKEYTGPTIDESKEFTGPTTDDRKEYTGATNAESKKHGVPIIDESKKDYDYIIEDPTSYDTSDEDIKIQATPEMKRLAQWYPKSKPLAFDNNGYKLFPGVGWFKLVPWAERWSNASKVCGSEGAHLAIPDTSKKMAIFLKIFENYPDVLEESILSDQVYVGVYNIGGDHREFHTVQGKLFEPDFQIWFPGEPDNANPGEDCVTFHKKGKIRDVPCFYNLPFLCEKAPDIS